MFVYNLSGYLGFSFARWSITLLATYFFVRLFTFYQIILTFDVFKPSKWLLSVLQIAWRSLPQQPCNLQMTKPHQGHLSNIFYVPPQGWRSLQQQPCNLQITKPHQGNFHNIFYVPSQGWRSLLQQPCNLQMTKPHQGHYSSLCQSVYIWTDLWIIVWLYVFR